MKKLIYYPNFEPPSTNWLKFAILYLDRLESIVPYNRIHLISDDYLRLQNETNLVELFSPTDSQGYRATLNAITETEKFLQKPYQFSGLFNKSNVLRDWRNPDTWNYEIYEGKFSYSWIAYCEEQKIGIRTQDGILLTENLAFLYMTHLAKEIAYDREADIITDNLSYDHYTSFSRGRTPLAQRHQFIKGIIELKVPQNLNSISVQSLIDFRNRNIELINSFNQQIDLVENAIGNGITDEQFIINYNYTLNSLIAEIKNLAINSISIPLGFYALATHANVLNYEYAKEILTGLGIVHNGYHAIKKSLRDSRNERNCRKYLVRLSHLN